METTKKKVVKKITDSVMKKIVDGNDMFSLFDNEGDLVDNFKNLEEIDDYINNGSDDSGLFYVYKLTPYQKITATLKLEKQML